MESVSKLQCKPYMFHNHMEIIQLKIAPNFYEIKSHSLKGKVNQTFHSKLICYCYKLLFNLSKPGPGPGDNMRICHVSIWQIKTSGHIIPKLMTINISIVISEQVLPYKTTPDYFNINLATLHSQK